MVRSERKEREFNLRRAEILKQAEAIFAFKGFHNVTMAEIATASGFSIGSLYQFFEGKENLYATMISEKFDLLYAKVREAPASVENIIEKIDLLVDAHLRFVEQNTNFILILIKGEITSMSEDMQSLRQKFIEGYNNHITFMEHLLDDGMDKGLLRKLPSRDMAEALFNLIRASSVTWILSAKEESLLSKKGFIMDIFLNGVKKND